MCKHYHNYLLAIGMYAASVSMAQAIETSSLQDAFAFLKSSYVVSLSAGPGWESAGQNQTFYLTPDIIKTYDANHSTYTFANGELFLGVKDALPRQMEGQFGLALVATGAAKLSGDIWDDADPLFNNYNYQYKLNRTALALKAKLLGQWSLPVIPWISAAAGVGFNHAYGYTSTPTIPEAVGLPNFASHTVTAFTYAIGVGVQKSLDPHWQVGVGYEFSDWGKSQLSEATGQTSGSGLSLNHLYTSSVLVNLTYLG